MTAAPRRGDARRRSSRLVSIVSSALLLGGGALAATAAGHGTAGSHHGVGRPPARTAAPARPAGSGPGGAPVGSPAVPAGGLRPVEIEIPLPSVHHPDGLRAEVVAHPLDADGSLYVPADPTVVSWSSADAAPGAPRGTAILVSHVNYVVDGRTVAGAFADLADYGRTGIGSVLTVRAASGRALRFRIASVVSVDKQRLAADPGLRAELFDQTGTYGSPPRGRLLLVSCGGPFDPLTGNYRDNVFLYATPVP